MYPSLASLLNRLGRTRYPRPEMQRYYAETPVSKTLGQLSKKVQCRLESATSVDHGTIGSKVKIKEWNPRCSSSFYQCTILVSTPLLLGYDVYFLTYEPNCRNTILVHIFVSDQSNECSL